MMKTTLVCLAFLLAAAVLAAAPQAEERMRDERLCFQVAVPWSPRINLGADVAIPYGIDAGLPERIASWRRRGYTIHVMTGVAWGNYQDYLEGRFDGRKHWDEAQTDSQGNPILHGGWKEIPYMSPGPDYGRYLCVGIQRALDAGADAIHLEEPEFWAAGGWEGNFKREWQAFYHEAWQAPDSSPDAQYRASKLKYYLYRRALSEIFDFVREYGRAHNRVIRCYVPSHSLINYAHWGIVSPESSLIQVGADGYIAQVWTGTARTPNFYESRRQERTFETAFLEYGAMQNLVRASGRRVWYLNDPVEDDPNHDWNDYRFNWESTLTASLLQPEVWHYEIMPWPDRVFDGRYPARSVPETRSVAEAEKAPAGTGLNGVLRPRGDAELVPIPPAYATELQTVVRALGEMKQSDVRWRIAGTRGAGVLVSDTMMFQRAAPHPSDLNLGSFYGLALPLLKRGVPVEPVQIESATAPGFLARYRLLLLTYEGQKPPESRFHEALAGWVRAGGALLVVDDDQDPYHAVREWWNTAPLAYRTPRQHLFEQLGLARDAEGPHRVGQGIVVRAALSSAALTYQATGADIVRTLARQAAAAVRLEWRESNALALQRGPYVVAAGLDESVPEVQPAVLSGRFVDLFDAELPVRDHVDLAPGKRVLLFDLDAARGTPPHVVAAACRIRSERFDGAALTFTAEGIAETRGVVRVAVPRPPAKVLVAGKPVEDAEYDAASATVRLVFPNTVEPMPVEITLVGG
ncbi:MAG: hypothetical protein PHE83_17720 [Opitutaceae bacterium]|nr:hypothetical protein [Opitutaceae bacterium]